MDNWKNYLNRKQMSFYISEKTRNTCKELNLKGIRVSVKIEEFINRLGKKNNINLK